MKCGGEGVEATDETAGMISVVIMSTIHPASISTIPERGLGIWVLGLGFRGFRVWGEGLRVES